MLILGLGLCFIMFGCIVAFVLLEVLWWVSLGGWCSVVWLFCDFG